MFESLYTAEQTRGLDRVAIEEFGIPASTLMARAADSVFRVLSEQYPDQKRIAIFCGIGNNGGDGFVLARICQPLGYKVTVFFIGKADQLKGDALESFERLQGTEASIEEYREQDLSEYDLIVDALFGSGLCRDVTGQYADAIRAINRYEKTVVSVDLPSGLNANTGKVMGVAVRATTTVTFIGRKQGLFTNEGPEHAGEVIFSRLKVPDEVYTRVPKSSVLLGHSTLSDLWPRRSLNSHKGDFGHVLVVGGNEGYSGAARLAGEGALRVGSGLVSVATREKHASILNVSCPELMVQGCEKPSELRSLLSQVSVLAVGPGLGQDRWAETAFETALDSALPLVLDADGLNLLAKNPIVRGDWVLTPHPGEAARLLECTVKEIQNDRFAAAQELASKFSAIVVLKGCGSIVASEKGVRVCPYGNPGMASGGMGDVLTGMLAGLIGQNSDLNYTVDFGVSLHSFAADLLYEDYGVGYGAQGILSHPLPKPF